MNDNLALAEILAGRGWKIFPCDRDKKPKTAHGYKDASCDPDLIKAWFKQYPTALIGIACKPSGLFVVDVDVKNNVDGWQGFDEIRKKRPLPVGPAQKTPSGGTHLFFQHPDFPVPNNAGILAPGVDLRSTGYVCSGRGYRWIIDHGPDAELKDAPGWLLSAIKKLHPMNQPSPIPQAERITSNNGNLADEIYKHYLNKAIPGRRNGELYRMGLQLYYAEIPYPEALDLARRFAREVVQSPDEFTEREAELTMQSAYAPKPKRNPWK